MDKYEYKLKLEQIEKMAAKKDYITAAKIADGIDWRKEKSISTLTKIADIYEANGRFGECYELLTMVYDRSPIGRRVVFRMAEVAVKMGNFEEAIELYKEFVKIAPHDLNKYILKYQIQRGRGVALADQIAILEEFKTHEYDERWAYELACLYEEAGMIGECVEECDELILWFSEGEYVVKAMELKMKYQELTATQQEKYEHRFEYLEEEVLPEVEAVLPEMEMEAEGEEAIAEADEAETDEADEAEAEDVEEAEAVETESVEAVETEIAEEKEEMEAEVPEEVDTPQISEINLNKFSTINLQKELAKNLEELLAQIEESEEEPVQGDTQEFVPFKEIIVEEDSVEEAVEKEVVSETEEFETVEEPEMKAEEVVEAEFEEEAAETENTEEEAATVLSETGELQTELLKYIAVPQENKMEEYLRTEEDGQMTLVMEEEHSLEKQITGQMTIEQILEAWEEKKRQVREELAAAEAKKPAVLFETGEISSLLEDFIPKMPKELVEAVEEAEEEKEVEAEAEAEVEAEIEAEIEKEIEVEIEAQEEAEEEPDLIDDLPQDIDLEEALEAFLEEPEKEAAAEPETEGGIEETVAEPETETETEAEEVAEPVAEEAVEEDAADRKAAIGENTASMIDAIERALALEIEPLARTGAYLTEEQEKIFAYFTSVNGMKKQLVALLEEQANYAGREDSKEGNLIITGHPGNGKTTLAIDIVKVLQKQRKVKGAKLAKVSGEVFNKKNPEEVIQKLGGGALIIERAGRLKDEIVELLSAAMEEQTSGLLVILEDDISEIKCLMKKHESFAEKFNRTVDIPIFSNDELVAFGKSYAEEKEYFFDDMAVLALYDCIGVRQTSEHVVNITEVKEFIDEAIEHAEKKSKGFFAKLSKKRIDEYGNRLLLEEDFNC